MHTFIAVLALLPALLFSQVPELMQQYRQRLGGAADELATVIRHFEEDARRSGYDRATAIGIMANNSERLIRDQATRWNDNIDRLQRLREQELALKDGVTPSSFVAFATNYDKQLFDKTYEAFVPALPLSFAGAVFTISGWLVAYAAMFLGVLGLRFGSRALQRA